MKSLRFGLNISRRTLYAFFPWLTQPDDVFAQTLLPPNEYLLYLAMDVRDRDHACRVAKAVRAGVPDASEHLLRAALLHDIGKSGSDYNPLERILVHLFTPVKVAASPHLKGLRGAWQRNLHHAYYGAQKIRAAGGCERVAALVEAHHQPGNDPEAASLKAIEETF